MAEILITKYEGIYVLFLQKEFRRKIPFVVWTLIEQSLVLWDPLWLWVAEGQRQMCGTWVTASYCGHVSRARDGFISHRRLLSQVWWWTSSAASSTPTSSTWSGPAPGGGSPWRPGRRSHTTSAPSGPGTSSSGGCLNVWILYWFWGIWIHLLICRQQSIINYEDEDKNRTV